jgi:hypothetical protein
MQQKWSLFSFYSRSLLLCFTMLCALLLTAPTFAQSGGTLAGNRGTPSGAINLSAEGSTDWAHWGLASGATFNSKSGATVEITNYTKIGSATVGRYTNNPISYSWSGGTPTASTTNTTTGVSIDGLNNGFQISAPADTTQRTLKVYVGVWDTRGELTATLSDNSAAQYVDSSLVTDWAQGSAVYTLTYRAASAGQTLTVRWINKSSTGNVTLQAATLAGGSFLPPTNTPVQPTHTPIPATPIPTGATVRIMPLGDSTTQYDWEINYRSVLWNMLTAQGYNVDFVGSMREEQDVAGDKDHEGHGGWEIGQLSGEVPPPPWEPANRPTITTWISTYQPDIVLIHAGINDILHGIEAVDAAARLERLIDRIYQTKPNTRIIIAQLIPHREEYSDVEYRLFNSYIPGIVSTRAAQGRLISYVDMHSALDQLADIREYYPPPNETIEDYVHPTASGYQKMAQVWYNELIRYLPR